METFDTAGWFFFFLHRFSSVQSGFSAPGGACKLHHSWHCLTHVDFGRQSLSVFSSVREFVRVDSKRRLCCLSGKCGTANSYVSAFLVRDLSGIKTYDFLHDNDLAVSDPVHSAA